MSRVRRLRPPWQPPLFLLANAATLAAGIDVIRGIPAAELAAAASVLVAILMQTFYPAGHASALVSPPFSDCR